MSICMYIRGKFDHQSHSKDMRIRFLTRTNIAELDF